MNQSFNSLDSSDSFNAPGGWGAGGADDPDGRFMVEALKCARAGLEEDEVPVGAVVVYGGRIIGRGYNQREKLADPTAHAEMLAITAAAQARGTWHLEECTIYVTLEPCVMCAGAIVLARIERLVYGAPDPKAGACGSLYNVPTDRRLNHRLEVIGGVLAEQAGGLLTDFFRKQRKLGKK